MSAFVDVCTIHYCIELIAMLVDSRRKWNRKTKTEKIKILRLYTSLHTKMYKNFISFLLCFCWILNIFAFIWGVGNHLHTTSVHETSDQSTIVFYCEGLLVFCFFSSQKQHYCNKYSCLSNDDEQKKMI